MDGGKENLTEENIGIGDETFSNQASQGLVETNTDLPQTADLGIQEQVGCKKNSDGVSAAPQDAPLPKIWYCNSCKQPTINVYGRFNSCRIC